MRREDKAHTVKETLVVTGYHKAKSQIVGEFLNSFFNNPF